VSAPVHPIRGPNAFKLGIFSANADGGLTVTAVPERWKARWPDIVKVAQLADDAGIEFFLPIARWKGFGGQTNAREHSFETFTFAAALGALTRNIGVFSTVHVPMIHPVYAAKALASVDHMSGGRAGLNIVAGWNPDEFAMFGIERDPEGYAQAMEWYEIIVRIFTEPKPFDYDARYYKLKNVAGRPQPLQLPRPVVLNAAFGGPGRDFAARASDFLFTTFSDIESGKGHIDDIVSRGRAVGREIGVFTTCHVVCRPTQGEAEDYYERYAVTERDEAAVDFYIAQKKKFASSHDEATFRLHAKRFAGGGGTYPLVGTPRHIVDEMVKMHRAGFAGTTVSFLNFLDELPYFIDGVLPLMREAGLRA
jgi:alkanesulfonate monooxygenase SsuD/methylene tetrahydromethanopterin reductase-like flavin-dependent oxidoreductase (luciferase family)